MQEAIRVPKQSRTKWLWLATLLMVTGCSWNRPTSMTTLPSSNLGEINGPVSREQLTSLSRHFNESSSTFESQPRELSESSKPSIWRRTVSKIVQSVRRQPSSNLAADPVSLASGIPPLGPEVYYHAGVMAEERNNTTEALRQYQRALETTSDFLPAMTALARLMDRLGNHDQALGMYESATKAHPKKANTFNALGMSLLEHHEFSAAIINLQQAVRLASENVRYRNNLAIAYVRAGQPEMAIAQLQAVHPPSIAHFNLAYFAWRMNDKSRSVEHLQLALKHDSHLQPAQSLLAQIMKDTAATQMTSSDPEGFAVSTASAIESLPTEPSATGNQYR